MGKRQAMTNEILIREIKNQGKKTRLNIGLLISVVLMVVGMVGLTLSISHIHAIIASTGYACIGVLFGIDTLHRLEKFEKMWGKI